MPNLQTLQLHRVKIADDFFLALCISAAGSKLQSIHHEVGPDISPAASEAYAKSICTMPNLQTLQLHYVEIADDFFLALCTSAAGAKIQRMELRGASMSASILHSVLHLPCLSSLTVRDVRNEISMSRLGSNKEKAENELERLIRCDTSEDLDPFCREVNAEGRLLISVEHGKPSMHPS
ncbi:uncharacterized protein [Diadema setosum]|uniref:uncharacterized protein n=1 Tax=Diadema setosum TaxID=31175 RepID=UPI003B3A69E7